VALFLLASMAEPGSSLAVLIVGLLCAHWQ